MTVYLDSNVFIGAVEATVDEAAPARQLIELLRFKRGVGCASEITLAEVLATPRRPDALPLHIERRVYLDLIVWSGAFTLVEVSRRILLETADLRRVMNMKLVDSIHLASALQSRCRYFVSHDKGLRRMPNGISVVRLDHRSISKLIAEIT